MKENGPQKVLVPRDMVTKPFFPAIPQDRPRTVVVSENTSYLIGYKDDEYWKFGETRAFDIRHGKLMFILLSLVELHKIENADKKAPLPLKVSVYRLCKMFYPDVSNPGKKQYKEIGSLLGDLRSIVVKYDHEDNENIFTVLFYDTEAKRNRSGKIVNKTFFITDLRFSPTFLKYFLDTERLNIRLDVMLSLKSNLAVSVYTYIPSRASHHSHANPFKISFKELLMQVERGRDFPTKSERLREFYAPERNRNIFSELDGKQTLTGTLRATYEEAEDDYHAIFWIEKSEQPLQDDAFLKHLFQQYKIPDSLHKRLLKGIKGHLNDYAAEKICSLGIDIEQNHDFYVVAQNILGELAFNSIVGQIATELNSGTSSIASPGAVLGHRLKMAIQTYFKTFQDDLFQN